MGVVVILRHAPLQRGLGFLQFRSKSPNVPDGLLFALVVCRLKVAYDRFAIEVQLRPCSMGFE